MMTDFCRKLPKIAKSLKIKIRDTNQNNKKQQKRIKQIKHRSSLPLILYSLFDISSKILLKYWNCTKLYYGYVPCTDKQTTYFQISS